MNRTNQDRRGFTGVELMVVVVVIGLLGGAVAGSRLHLKWRAAERVVRGDLDGYAQAQMAVRHEAGHFAAHPALMGTAFEWSAEVEVSDVVVVDDRFFLRLRHARTGYACAIDFSPVTGRARNRKVCRGSEDDPALARPPGIIITPPGGDTVTVVRPPEDPQAHRPTLLPPAVGDVAEATVEPGASRVVVFPLTNRSAEARSFTFGVSSANAGLVPEPARPADARLEPAEQAGIPVTVSVAPGALADQATEVELRAADTGDRGYAASGRVRVRAALALARPRIAAPAPEIRDAGETFTVLYRVTNASNAARVLRLRSELLPGSALSLAAPLADVTVEAGQERMMPVTYRLDPGAEGGSAWDARVVVADRDAPAYAETSTPFHVTARLALEPPVVSGVPGRTEVPGAEFTIVWQIANRSNAPREIRLTAGSVSPDLAAVTPAGSVSRTIARGATASFPVTYRLAPRTTCQSIHGVSLRAEDAGAPALAASGSGEVRAATVLAAPVVAPPGSRSDGPGTSFTATWQVTNASNCEREIQVEALPAGDVEVVSATGVGIVRLQPFERRAAEVTYRVRGASLYQAESRPALRAADAAAPGQATTQTFVTTTALALCAPTVAGPIGVPPQPQQPGTGATVVHRVSNCSNAPRVFSFRAASANPGAVPDPADPAGMTIPAFSTRDVAFTYVVPPLATGAAVSDLAFRVEDEQRPALAAASAFRAVVAVVPLPPVLSAFAGQTIMPGDVAASSAVLTSRSNVAADYCFESSVHAGTAEPGKVVAPSPAAPECIAIAPYGSATVRQLVTGAPGAEHNWSNEVSVRAYDAARTALASEQRFLVAAALVLVDPTLVVPATPPPLIWMAGQERTVEYPVTNESNAPRDLCLTVVTGAELAGVSPAEQCATVGARQPFSFRHTLRGDRAGDVRTTVRVYDRHEPARHAEGAFLATVVDAAPIARWTPPSPVYVRKWAEFDGGQSSSPVGARIVKYVWSWGLINQRWTGTRFEPGGSGVATDELSTATTRRAWDYRGAFQVCLVVEDDAGRRSRPACEEVRTLMESRARLAFRYRGWWYDPSDFCFDAPWDNQCPDAHGNARWEILLNQSQGDVPIRRAWASVRVEFWQTDDRFARAFSYAGNVETLPYTLVSGGQTLAYDFMSNRHKASGSVESGRWRVLDTNGTSALGWPRPPGLDLHPLVLNVNLGSATGVWDTGPHWVPNTAWITLFVEDAHGGVTSQTASLDHARAEWRGGECLGGTSGWGCIEGYERLSPPREEPRVVMSKEDLGDWVYRYTGSGSSPDGRVVDWWWETTVSSYSAGTYETRTSREPVLEVRPRTCEIVDVALVYVDDRGQRGHALDRVVRGEAEECIVAVPL